MEYEGAVQPKAPLPDGWVAFADEDGAEYYFKPETGETPSSMMAPYKMNIRPSD